MTITEDEKKAALNILNGIAMGSTDVTGDCYKWVKKYQHLLERLLSPTPPPVDGDLAAAVEWLQGIRNGETVEKYKSVIIQAATSQQARECPTITAQEIWEKYTPAEGMEVYFIANAGLITKLATDFPNGVRIVLSPEETEALSAKNIIQLKDGGGE